MRLVRSGLFDRSPAPKVVVAHLGGVLPWLRERAAVYTGATDQFGGPDPRSRPMVEYLDELYMDSVAYGLGPREYCWRTMGASRILFGSDHPFARPAEPGRLLDSLPCPPGDRERIAWRNACFTREEASLPQRVSENHICVRCEGHVTQSGAAIELVPCTGKQSHPQRDLFHIFQIKGISQRRATESAPCPTILVL